MQKEKVIRVVLSRRQVLALLLPVTIATIIVAYTLVPPETLGYFSDAYTIAVIFTLMMFVFMEWELRRK